MISRKSIPAPAFNFKPYKPQPHPMQHRIDEFRALPSLYTGPRK